MTKQALARLVMIQVGARDDEGWCALCGKRVGNLLPCNDHRHADHCAVHELRKAAK